MPKVGHIRNKAVSLAAERKYTKNIKVVKYKTIKKVFYEEKAECSLICWLTYFLMLFYYFLMVFNIVKIVLIEVLQS